MTPEDALFVALGLIVFSCSFFSVLALIEKALRWYATRRR
jgi:hypothetical protein